MKDNQEDLWSSFSSERLACCLLQRPLSPWLEISNAAKHQQSNNNNKKVEQGSDFFTAGNAGTLWKKPCAWCAALRMLEWAQQKRYAVGLTLDTPSVLVKDLPDDSTKLAWSAAQVS